MILDILHSLLNVSEPRLFETLLRRIRLWQAFMERDTRPLSHEEEVGVIGELTCLERLIESGLAPSTPAKEDEETRQSAFLHYQADDARYESYSPGA